MILGGELSYDVPVLFTNEEHYNPVETYEIFYVDVDKDVEHWRPLLKEAQERLEGKVSTSAEVKKGHGFLRANLSVSSWMGVGLCSDLPCSKVSKVYLPRGFLKEKHLLPTEQRHCSTMTT